VDEAAAALGRHAREVVLEDAAIELVARRRQQRARAELGDAIDVVTAVGEEEAEAELLELALLEVGSQPEHLAEVVRRDLDGRLAHLVGRDRQRMPVALEDQDVQLREALAELQRQREAGKPAAQDDHVVIRRTCYRTFTHEPAASSLPPAV